MLKVLWKRLNAWIKTCWNSTCYILIHVIFYRILKLLQVNRGWREEVDRWTCGQYGPETFPQHKQRGGPGAAYIVQQLAVKGLCTSGQRGPEGLRQGQTKGMNNGLHHSKMLILNSDLNCKHAVLHRIFIWLTYVILHISFLFISVQEFHRE